MKITHGLSHTSEYDAYNEMLKRCYNKKCKKYKNYGARGIVVCEKWLGENGFVNFYNDMGTKPSKKHSLHRINNNKNYEPENCKWATYKEQANEKTTSRKLTFNKQTKTMKEWSEITGINYYTIRERIDRRNWSVEKALTTPSDQTYTKKRYDNLKDN